MFCDIKFFGELNGNLNCPNRKEHRQFRIDEIAVLASTEIRSGKKSEKLPMQRHFLFRSPKLIVLVIPNEWDAQASEVETQITQLVPTLSADDLYRSNLFWEPFG